MRTLFLVPLLMWSVLASAEMADVSAFEKEESPLKALVFLSDECPCSRSHIDHLNKLAEQGLKLYGVVSEPINDGMSAARREQLETYFKSSGFKFPIINDKEQTLVKQYSALKTPHATLFQKQNGVYRIVYQGGVTNQKDFEKSTIKYLQENVVELQAGRGPKYKNGHSLGCYIRRI